MSGELFMWFVNIHVVNFLNSYQDPVVVIPSTYFIGINGAPLEVVASYSPAQQFIEKIKAVTQVRKRSYPFFMISSVNLYKNYVFTFKMFSCTFVFIPCRRMILNPTKWYHVCYCIKKALTVLKKMTLTYSCLEVCLQSVTWNHENLEIKRQTIEEF